MDSQPPSQPPTQEHVTLPFNLRDDPRAFGNRANQDLLMQLFPHHHTIGVGFNWLFLFLYVSEMPPKPWPKTVAGLPLYFAPRPGSDYCPLPTGKLVHSSNGVIAEEIHGRYMETWTPLFEAVRDYFLTLEISITQVIYWGNFLQVVLENRETDMTKLPWTAGGISCMYLFDDEMGKPPSPQTLRQTDASDTVPPEQQPTKAEKPKRTGDFVVLDMPDTGRCVGTFIGEAYQRVDEPEQQRVSTDLYYMGQDVGHTLSGGDMSGRAIRDEEGNVVGISRYAPQGGLLQDWCVGTTASHLPSRDLLAHDTWDRKVELRGRL